MDMAVNVEWMQFNVYGFIRNIEWELCRGMTLT